MREKRLIGGGEDSLQLFPTNYGWAWDMYLECLDNTWSPREISMGPDIALWKSGGLTEGERHLFLGLMSQLTTFDLQRGDDAAESIAPLVTAPEIKLFLKRLADEEVLHSYSYQFIVENMGLDPEDIYTRYRKVPEMKARVDMANEITDLVSEIQLAHMLRRREGQDIVEWTLKEKQDFLFALCFWFVLYEATWFLMNLLGPLQNMARQGKFVSSAEQFRFIAKDEYQHVRFGINLINDFQAENPECLTEEFTARLNDMFKKGILLEENYCRYCIGSGVLGYSITSHMETAKFLLNLKLKGIGMEPIYSGVSHQLPWISEMMELNREESFFEVRAKEYRTGSALDWGDDDIEDDWSEQIGKL